MSDKPRRLGLRFSLRLLLTLACAVCIFFAGWSANEWKHRRELERLEREALLNILTSGSIAP